MEIEEPYKDEKGRVIKEFDLIKVFHFKGVNEKGRGRKNYYMYKWIHLEEHKGKLYYKALHLQDNNGGSYFLMVHRGEDRVIKGVEIVQTKYTG